MNLLIMDSSHIILRDHISARAFHEATRYITHASTECVIQPHAWQLHNRLGLHESQLALAFLLLDHARHQKLFASSPLLSRFGVGASISCGPAKVAHGVNMEFGAGPGKAVNEGVHSEEAALANALSLYGRDTRVEFVALVTDSAQPSTPCGKCRSLLETYSLGDPVIVSAGVELTAAMWKLSELMPVSFEAVNITAALRHESTLITALRTAVHQGLSLGVTPLSKQALGLDYASICADGTVYSVPRVDSLAFYPTTALRATIAATLAANPSRIDAVFLSSRSGLPIGEDRQLLLEFANFFGQVESLPIYLHTEGHEELRRATPATLLPHAFGPQDLSLHT